MPAPARRRSPLLAHARPTCAARARHLRALALVTMLPVTALAACGACETPTLSDLQALLVPDRARVDFAEVYLGTSRTETVRLENVGNRPLTVDAVDATGSSAFRVDTSLPLIVAAGAAGTLSITFRPADEEPVAGSITVRSDAENLPEHVVSLAGQGRAVPPCPSSPCRPGRFDTTSGSCVPLVDPDGTPCDDASACTVDDVCLGGQCLGRDTSASCADDVACTLDLCASAGGCTHIPDHASCADSDPCTLDVCDLELGCTHEVAADYTPCGTAAPCQSIPLCVGGLCSDFAIPDGTACNDLDACTQGDACFEGACLGIDTELPPTLAPPFHWVGAGHTAAVDPATGRLLEVGLGGHVVLWELDEDGEAPAQEVGWFFWPAAEQDTALVVALDDGQVVGVGSDGQTLLIDVAGPDAPVVVAELAPAATDGGACAIARAAGQVYFACAAAGVQRLDLLPGVWVPAGLPGFVPWPDVVQPGLLTKLWMTGDETRLLVSFAGSFAHPWNVWLLDVADETSPSVIEGWQFDADPTYAALWMAEGRVYGARPASTGGTGVVIHELVPATAQDVELALLLPETGYRTVVGGARTGPLIPLERAGPPGLDFLRLQAEGAPVVEEGVASSTTSSDDGQVWRLGDGRLLLAEPGRWRAFDVASPIGTYGADLVTGAFGDARGLGMGRVWRFGVAGLDGRLLPADPKPASLAALGARLWWAPDQGWTWPFDRAGFATPYASGGLVLVAKLSEDGVSAFTGQLLTDDPSAVDLVPTEPSHRLHGRLDGFHVSVCDTDLSLIESSGLFAPWAELPGVTLVDDIVGGGRYAFDFSVPPGGLEASFREISGSTVTPVFSETVTLPVGTDLSWWKLFPGRVVFSAGSADELRWISWSWDPEPGPAQVKAIPRAELESAGIVSLDSVYADAGRLWFHARRDDGSHALVSLSLADGQPLVPEDVVSVPGVVRQVWPFGDRLLVAGLGWAATLSPPCH